MNATSKHVKSASILNTDGSLTQCELLHMALAEGPKTTDELRCLGIFSPAQRVRDLVKRGYAIAVELTHIVDHDGCQRYNVARYQLEGSPC